MTDSSLVVCSSVTQFPLGYCRASVFPRARNFRVGRGIHDNLKRIFLFYFFQLYYNGDIGGRLALQ